MSSHFCLVDILNWLVCCLVFGWQCSLVFQIYKIDTKEKTTLQKMEVWDNCEEEEHRSAKQQKVCDRQL